MTAVSIVGGPCLTPSGLEALTLTFEDDTITALGLQDDPSVIWDQAAANLAAFTGCDRHKALAAATSTPAGIIGEARRGRLDPGSIADLVLLDDDYRVRATICEGRVAYVDDAAQHRLPASLAKAP